MPVTAFRTTDDSAPELLAIWRPRLIDLTERVCVCTAFLWYFFANWSSHNWLNIVIASTDVITVGCILFRKPTSSVSLDPQDWALALGGTLLSMFARPGGIPLVPAVLALCMVAEGTLIAVAAKLSLNRRFGVTPANRGIQMRGAYVFIRHPMYLGYVLIHCAYLLMNPTVFNAALLGMTWGFQYGRIMREERWLMQDSTYRRYAKIVRFRFIPGVF